MSQFDVDGTLTIAKLKRRVPGGAIYQDITFRRADGAVESVGTMRIAYALTDAMAPGARGRFYFHAVAGTKGLHGFRAQDGRATFHFSPLLERIMGIMAAINIAMFLLIAIAQGRTNLTHAVLAVATAGFCLLLVRTRRASARAFDADRGHSARIAAALRRPATA